MDVPISWLKEYVDIDCDVKTFEEKMTMSGSKVENIHSHGADITGVVIGRIISVKKHPGADKLFVTQVYVGSGQTRQIVTGAANLAAGDCVPVALDGAVLPGGAVIRSGSLRGELSDGMLCSISELGRTKNDYPEADEDGIYVLPPGEYTLGADIRPVMRLSEDVAEFEITSNRPDCNSVLGIAREAAATFDKPFKPPAVSVRADDADGDAGDCAGNYADVEIRNAELCPRYIARVVKNVKIAPSPLWLRHRLTMAGVRPINNIVDITNYVMIEYGQPLHAFDIDGIHISGESGGRHKIIVRTALDGENFVTLDGAGHTLDSSMLVIADSVKAVAVAGVMGGENSKVTENASAVLFEAAAFNGTSVRLTSKKLGLRTDASSKFEKGLDPNLPEAAINRAMQLVELLECGNVVRGMVDVYPDRRDEWRVAYDCRRVNALLGTAISPEDMEKYLARVGIRAENGAAVIPTFRSDIESEADIAEEVARMYGYDNIKTTLAAGTPTVGKRSFRQRLEDFTRDIMSAYGFCECLDYSFEGPRVFDKLRLPADSPLRDAVTILNPMGEDFSIMRTVTLNGILQSIATNYNRRNESAALYELGYTYSPKALPLAELPEERLKLTLAAYGEHDFFSVKGVLAQFFENAGIADVTYEARELPFLHPFRCASVAVGGGEAGFLGELNPFVAQNYGIGVKTVIACLDMGAVAAHASFDRAFTPLPKFPAVTRDISMLAPDDISAADIERVIRENAGNLLESVRLFDVYRGSQVAEGLKSVAYSLSFRSLKQTLSDADVAGAMSRILDALEKRLGARLR